MPRFPDHPAVRPVVISGASSGIGAAAAHEFAGRGFPVMLGARRVERCTQIVEVLRKQGLTAAAAPLDVTIPESVERFIAAAERAHGPTEIAVANAGAVWPIRADAHPDDFLAQIAANLLGAQSLVARVLPGMVARGRGDVVLVSSDSALRPRTYMAGYAAAKAGLEAFAAVMRSELEGTGVRVSVVRPGPASTEQGTTWDVPTVEAVIESWSGFGFLRHDGALQAWQVANAIAYVATAPRGALISELEIQPEAPLHSGRSPHLRAAAAAETSAETSTSTSKEPTP